MEEYTELIDQTRKLNLYTTSEVSEVTLHETVWKLTKLFLIWHGLSIPQKWLGSSVALGYDTDIQLTRSRDNEEKLRQNVVVNIFGVNCWPKRLSINYLLQSNVIAKTIGSIICLQQIIYHSLQPSDIITNFPIVKGGTRLQYASWITILHHMMIFQVTLQYLYLGFLQIPRGHKSLI